MEYPLVTALINLDAIGQNIKNLISVTKKDSKFMAVVKADGYGHGAVPVAKKALQSGAHWLGVARLNEAIELRSAGIKAPILVLGYIHPSYAGLINELDLVTTVFDFEMAKRLSLEARALNKKVKTHLKVDTGMGRIGIIVSNIKKTNVVEEITKLKKLPGIDLNGIYTHFAAADSPNKSDKLGKSYTNMQMDLFSSLLWELKKQGVEFEMRHAANSAGIIEFPDSHFDMVRAGISIYGFYPSLHVDQSKVKLFAAMTLKSIVTAVRKVPKGFYVSYGMTHETQQDTCLASVPIGYADGYSRQFSSNGLMLVKGKRAPVVGRVYMDQTMIDVGHIPDIKTGDEVVVIGSQKNETISADELADRINTINYEIVSSLTSRIKRIYSDSGSGSG
jgi:alanine racemase